MKLKRLFCYKYFCFLFFLIFAGGVGFAGAGKIKPTDSAVTIVWDGTAWRYENGNNVSWLDKNDSTVTGPNGSNDIIALNSTNYSITIRLEAYLAITSLFVFGEHPCTIDLHGYEFSVQNLFLGSSFDNSGDLDGGVIANDQDSLDNGITDEASKLGNLKIVNEGTGPKSIAITNFDTTTWRYSDDKLTQNLLDIGSNVSFNVNGSWDCGTTDGATGDAEGAKAIHISIADQNSVTVNGYVQDENSPIRQQIQQDIANGGSTPETPDVQPYIWYGSYSSAWGDTENWSTGEIPPDGEDVTIETEADGNDPVLSSEISLNSIVFNTSSTLTIASGGSLKIDPNSLSGDYSILIESGGAFISSAANDFTIENNFKSSSKGTIKTENSNCAITINTNFDGPINFDCVGNITLEANNEVKFGTVNANTFTNNGTATVNTKLTSGTVTNNGKLTINGDIEATSVEILSGTLSIDGNKLASGNVNAILISETATLISMNSFTIESKFDSNSKGTIKTENLNCAITINTNFDGPINFDCVGNITLEANNEVKFGTVKANTFTNKGTATVNTNLTTGTVTNNGTLTINGQAETGNLTNNSIVTITDGNELLISKKIDNSNGNITGSVKFTGNNINPNSIHLGNDTSEYKNLTIDTHNEISFAGNPKINNLIVLNANGVTFTDSVTINNVNDEAYSGDFTFYSANFSVSGQQLGTSNIEFKTSGTVTFGSNENSTTTFGKDLTHTEGKTVIKGIFSAGANNLSLSETEINGSVSAESAEFGDTNLTGKLTSKTININSTLILDGQVNGNEINLSEIKLKASSLINSDSDTGSLSIKGNVGVDESVSEDSKVNLTLDVNTKIESNAKKIDVKNGNLLVLKNFISNVSLEINSNVYLYGNDGMETVFGSTDGTDTIFKIDINKKNLIISKKGKVNIKGLVSSNNFVLYSGNIELSGDISTSGDVILLGENYSLKDNQTGLQNLYSYNENRPAKWSKASYSFETELPNGTKLPDGTESNRFSGKVNVLSGKSITVGKNFYANGIELSGNGKWNLFIPDNSNAENSFCEAYNSTVLACQVECSDVNLRDKNVSKIAALQCTDNGGNENWVFDDVKISKAYSVSDKVIRVEFNAPVRIQKKYNQQSQLCFSNSPDENHLFEAVYLNDDCSQEADSQDDYYIVSQYDEENPTVYYCYFKANSTWNTDATGKSAGNPEKSTDYEGNPQNATICLDFPRAIQNGSAINSYIITDAWGTRLKNYSKRTINGDTKIPYGHNDDLENSVEDKTGPVLIAVKTGQENHTEYDSSKGAEGQHSYDAHNFIEFLYSEPVNFGSENIDVCDVWLKSDEKVENIQVTQKFGALQNEDITQSGQLKIAGLAKIQNGKIYTGSQGKEYKYVNALYRFDEYSLRYSIAGFTNKTQTVKDREGFEHKKWIGYIEEAEIPSGVVSMITEGKNSLVSDLKGNAQTLVKKELVVDSTENGVYGKWDISSPMFAPYHTKNSHSYSVVEAVGSNNGFGSTLDRIEFHLFDNTVKLDSSDEAVWLTEIGWCKNDGSASLILPDSYCADIFGGSRTFAANVQNRTGGGIRYSSLENVVKAFKYTTDSSGEISINFDNADPYTTVSSRMFTSAQGSSRSANKTDGLYFALSLQDKTLDVKSQFKISYDDREGFITDLAGNRLKSVEFFTIDRTSPSISAIMSPINQKDFYVIFLKDVVDEVSLLKNDDSTIIVSSFYNLLPKCFEIGKIDENNYFIKDDNLNVDVNVPAIKMEIQNYDYSVFKMTLNKEVSLDDVKKLYFRIVNPEGDEYKGLKDKDTGIENSAVTLIQDEYGNYINMYETHALSDVAINGIIPLYGYNPNIRADNIKEDSENLNYVVRDWNENQQNYGTFKHNEEITILCDVDSNSIAKNQFGHNVQMFINNDSKNRLLSEKFNSEIGGNLRIWFPNIMEKPFSFFTLKKNENYKSLFALKNDETDISKGIRFDFNKELVQQWEIGNQISFLFAYLNEDNSYYQIYPSPVYDKSTGTYNLSESVKYPLFALRLKDKNDITSLDLWSFKVKSVTEQRGGVSILNNVINATYGEKTIVKLNVPQAGNVDVMVMTLDGNIVTYLQHGAISAGEHYFTWNGKNNAGQKVARGLYFVRVIGPNLDETRKVMVVKD